MESTDKIDDSHDKSVTPSNSDEEQKLERKTL